MAKQSPSLGDQPRTKLRPGRPHRPYLWGLASWLKNGGLATAFYLAWRASTLGAMALAVFLSGLLLRELLEATSTGD